ncbi:unnamed protein product [Caenorhabditis angaria]|uniref:Carboxylic ester hydrolase n=1 Tax=Caenorhabditis angaria TaxID=860376 RepID=A0A9P1N975_9PELO|nr:unnamed protein product [Caenorhabditis angaria]
MGKLRGITEYSSDGNSKHIFKKIPFAKPPIGKLRFELPQKTEPWKGIKDASKYSAACISDPSASSTIQKKMDEDCLYLNIFTSQRCLESSNCSVIVYYHGGGFNMDSAVMFPDKFILERYVSEDIVFAIPAYRLGVFGLFNIGDENLVADNLALFGKFALDFLILALHFIHDNINSFGGDPNKVTLMGHSSGATLVGLFAFSKLIDPNKVLFQKIYFIQWIFEFIKKRTIGTNII